MADFKPILQKTFKFEGGYQAFPNDTANYNSRKELVGTNHGISATAYEQYLGRVPSVADIKAITETIAQQVYKKLFWDVLKGDAIKSDSVAHIMFDAFIASGYEGLKRVRKAINKYYGKAATPEVRSAITPGEVMLINNAIPNKLFDIVKDGEIANRKALAAANPAKYGAFLKGWLNRLDSIKYNKTAVGIVGLLFFLATAVTIVVTNKKSPQ